MSGWMLACWLAVSAASPNPELPTHNRYGEILRDDSNGILVLGDDWIGVGKILPGERTIHVMWTNRRRTDDEIAYPAIYSWCGERCQWIGYYGTPSDPYVTLDVSFYNRNEEIP